jgi:hypothetical protein
MMNFPAREPWKRRLRAAADTGKAIEKDLVRRWDWSGILLSPPPSEDGSHDDQLRFEYADLWLTGTADAVIRSRYDQSLPVPIEVKTKWHDVIEQMHLGVRGPDPAHIKQCKTEIAFVRAAMENGSLWPDSGLKFPTYGVIYYASRDDSSFTAEFRVDYDPHYWDVGCRVLAAVQEAYHADVLPQADDADQRRRHPMGAGWKWSQNACQYCDYKREICRKDHKYQVSKLSESNGTRWAEKVRGVPYDAATERARVLERWEGRTGTPRPIVASEVAA